MRSLIKQIYSFIQYHTPTSCLFCERTTQYRVEICTHCQPLLPIIYSPICQRCGINVPENDTTLTCNECTTSPPWFDHIVCAYHYEGTIPHCIQHIKAHANVSYLNVLCRALSQRIFTHYAYHTLPDILIASPMLKKKYLSRIANPAQLITEYLSAHLHIPYLKHAIHYKKSLQNQKTLNKASRARNINGAYESQMRLNGLHIALIDDIVTTGQTANELAKTLKLQGAGQVDIWALARTPIASFKQT